VRIEIERAHRDDESEVFHLVEQNHLPLAGLYEHFETAIVAREDGGRIVGTAALEMYRDGALLRSVAVALDVQRKGIGHQLTDAALALAHELRAPAVYLLTTTAERFFPRFGFEHIARTDVPPGVQTSVEFTSTQIERFVRASGEGKQAGASADGRREEKKGVGDVVTHWVKQLSGNPMW